MATQPKKPKSRGVRKADVQKKLKELTREVKKLDADIKALNKELVVGQFRML